MTWARNPPLNAGILPAVDRRPADVPSYNTAKARLPTGLFSFPESMQAQPRGRALL